MTDDPIVAAFIRAARVAGAVVASPEVAAAWDRDSALEQMTVGSVAGHLFLVVRRVDKHLDEPEPTRPPVRALIATRGCASRERKTSTARITASYATTARTSAVGARTTSRPRTSTGSSRVAARLATHCPAVVAVGELVIDFREYLSTRIVELLVHADDLAVSVGIGFTRNCRPTRRPSRSSSSSILHVQFTATSPCSGRSPDPSGPDHRSRAFSDAGRLAIVATTVVIRETLPPATTDLDRAAHDLRTHGVCRVKGALQPSALAAIRRRLREVAEAEDAAGHSYRYDKATRTNASGCCSTRDPSSSTSCNIPRPSGWCAICSKGPCCCQGSAPTSPGRAARP